MAPSHLVTTTVQATLLNAASNISAQLLTGKATSLFNLDLYAVFCFSLYAILTVPLNVIWQNFLERTFPAKTLAPSTGEKDKQEDELKINKRNLVLKVILDQTVAASFFTVAYLSFMQGVKGGSGVQMAGAVQNNFWSLMTAGWKVWPLVSILCFSVIPVDKRVVFASSIGFLWGIFLSTKQ